MELLSFYFINIIVGAMLAIVLGLYGSQIVARGQSFDVIVLGQSMQVGVLLGVLIIDIFHIGHDDHGLHIEIITGSFFACFIYWGYLRLSKFKKYMRVPLLAVFYITLLALGYLVVAASPLIESHMVKAFLGDIVTASPKELWWILFFSIFSLIFYLKNSKTIILQSFDLSTFGHLTSNTHKRIYYLFNIILLILMIYSVHVLGLVFTFCMMIFPITFFQFYNRSRKLLHSLIFLIGPLAVVGGFLLNIKYDDYPTSALIVVNMLILYLLPTFFLKRF